MSTVAVIGGGYGGITAAAALDKHVDVVLVEPKDSFFHFVGVLRALTRDDWFDRLVMPYDSLLRRGRVVRAAATAVSDGTVKLDDGQALTVDASIVATGTGYPFPVKPPTTDLEAYGRAIGELRGGLRRAGGAVILGAGPVGVELAGDLAADGFQATLVDPRHDVLGGAFSERLRASLTEQLQAMGVTLLLGDRLLEQSETSVVPGRTVTSLAGVELPADVIVRAYGASPRSQLLAGHTDEAGRVRVDDTLRVAGTERVWAIGDVTDASGPKLGSLAIKQAGVAARNIRAVLAGGAPMARWSPGRPTLIVPLGPERGAGQLPLPGTPVLGPRGTALAKGRGLMVGHFRKALGL